MRDNELGDKIKRPQNDLTCTIIAVRFCSFESFGIVEHDRGKQLHLRKLKISQTKQSAQVIF